MNSCESLSLNTHLEKDETSSPQQHQISFAVLMKQSLANCDQLEFVAMLEPLSHEINQQIPNKDLLTCKILHYRLMKHFYRLYKDLNSDPDSENKILFVLSLLAEIIRKERVVKLPFTRKIVQALLSFDIDALSKSVRGEKIKVIISLLLENISKQGKLAVKLRVAQELKQGLLGLLSKVNELFTLRILLKAITSLLCNTNQAISQKELESLGIARHLRDCVGDHTSSMIEMYLLRTITSSCRTLFQLVSQ